MLRMPIPVRDVKRESNSGTLHIHARGRSLSLSRYPYGGLAKSRHMYDQLQGKSQSDKNENRPKGVCLHVWNE
jgi:hypothetical protein